MQSTNTIDNRFQPFQVLNSGAFGIVYLANDLEANRTVALKFLNHSSPDALVRFRREAATLAKIRSPFIVELVHSNLGHAPPYIVMEFCEYGSLQSWVSQRRPWPDVVGVLAHVLQGLDALHSVGGFHRDLKPCNLLLAKHPVELGKAVVKLGDFGLAHVPGVTEGESQMTWTPAGTENYMAPELKKGSQFSTSADIYSLGVVATELLAGSIDLASLARVSIPSSLRQAIKSCRSTVPGQRPTVAGLAKVVSPLLLNPNAKATAELPPQEAQVDWQGLFVGTLLLAGTFIALAALANATEGKIAPPPVPTVG